MLLRFSTLLVGCALSFRPRSLFVVVAFSTLFRGIHGFSLLQKKTSFADENAYPLLLKKIHVSSSMFRRFKIFLTTTWFGFSKLILERFVSNVRMVVMDSAFQQCNLIPNQQLFIFLLGFRQLESHFNSDQSGSFSVFPDQGSGVRTSFQFVFLFGVKCLQIQLICLCNIFF